MDTSTTVLDERAVFAKISRRFMPILTVAYVLNYLDRNNISFAALSMNAEVGLSATAFGTGAGILFLGYCLFEVPSNLALYRVGARLWISRIMLTWGIVSAATMFVHDTTTWYVLRFALGAAEAGFFPGVAYFLSTWFPAEYRTRMLAWFLVAIPVSSVVGGPLSGALLQMHGMAGLSGWQWMFLLEGLPVVLIGVMMPWVLSDRPESADWLTEEERTLVRTRLDRERRDKEVRHLWPALKDPRVLVLAGVQFGFLVGSYGVTIWLPQIIKAGNFSDLTVGFMTSGCFIVASVGMLLWAGWVDRRGGKVVNLAAACLLSAVGLLLAIYTKGFWSSLAFVTIALTGITAARAIFWTIPPRFLSGMGAAAGLAFINSIGTMGGFVGPTAMGWLTDRTGSFDAGLAAMAGLLIIATGLAWSLRGLVKTD